MKKAFLALCMLLFVKANASHFSGGEMRYEFNGTNYTVHVTLFKVCLGGIDLQNNVTVYFQSTSLSASFSRTFNLVNFDTVNINCPSTVSSCYNPSSAIPGYIAAYYKDTVSLPLANDWIISTSNSARIGSITNLSTPGSMYLETRLDNTSSINSNPFIASIPTYYMTASNSISVPMQAVDPEGDSLVYQFINPLDGTAPGTPATYATGYSLTSPFGTGGVCAFNTTTKVLTMMAPSAGYYVVAFRVLEYRNGNLIGNYIRDMMVVVLAGSTALTFPNANTGTSFNVYTCPGQSNSVTLAFNDPTVTDSVYLNVMPPTIPGFTFSSSTSNGLGGATTTISWTTPSSLNPATLPQFFIRIRARDNACPNASADFGLVVRTRQCVSDTVWPGDANGDFTVNVYDPLAIAIASGQTGPTRTGATTSWTAQYCAPWANSFVTNNTNMKHADCNGDGTVNTTDLGAVASNYGLWHLKTTGGAHKTTAGAPDLYFDVAGISFAAGSTVNVPIKLGSSTAPMNNVYGLATRITIDGITPVNPPTISTAGSWLGASSLNFTKPTTNATIDWAHARTNHTNASGQGVVGMLTFTIPATVPAGTQIKLDFDNTVTRLIDYKGLSIIAYNMNEATATTVAASGISNVAATTFAALVVPNPSSSGAGVQVAANKAVNLVVEVTDVTGRKVWDNTRNLAAGNHTIALPDELKAGIYIVRVTNADVQDSQQIKWVKQ